MLELIIQHSWISSVFYALVFLSNGSSEIFFIFSIMDCHFLTFPEFTLVYHSI